MINRSPGCFANYNFNHIAKIAKQRFVDGHSTIDLLEKAKTDTEREEVALVCMLDIEDEMVLDIQLDCRYARDCKVTNCREKLRKLIESELKQLKGSADP